MSDRLTPFTIDTHGPCLRLTGHQPAYGTVLVDGNPAAGPWQHQNGTWETQVAGWRLCIDTPIVGALRLSVTNTDARPNRLNTVAMPRVDWDAFQPRLQTECYAELIHGGSFLGMASGVKRVGRRRGRLDFRTPSDMVTVYRHDDGRACLLGVLPPLGGAFCSFHDRHSAPHLEGDFGFEARHEFRCILRPGQTVSTSPVIALNGKDANALLKRYGDMWKEAESRRPSKPVRVGWNSWDYYAGAVTRDAVDENLAAAEKLFGKAVATICIDEGWETQWGTWEPNRKFAAGLEDFVKACRERGTRPGIWTAPLLVNTYNPLFYDHPDWFAGRDDGQLQTDAYAYGPMAYLDVTLPQVQDHINELFSRLRKTGFEYFKVDFTHCILKAERFHDASVPRADLVRSAFRTIRQAIGDDAYLLGCGAPYESVFGLVDAVRTTGDIHTYWGHVLMNAGAIAARWWMQDTMWNTDPDFLVVRGPETAAAPHFKRRVINPMPPEGGWMAGREFNRDEARAYALLVHLSGGDIMLGDRLSLLEPAGADIIRHVLQPREPAIPVDLFESDQALPRLWISKSDGSTLVGYFNWTDEPARVDLELNTLNCAGQPVDFWTGNPVNALPGTMRRRSAIALLYT